MPTATLPPTLRQALEAGMNGDPEQALHLLQAAAQQDPRSALAQYVLGAELAQQGRIPDAEAAFANAVWIAPALHIARFQLGLLLFTSSRVPLALVVWQPLFELGDQEPLCRFVQGLAALAVDDFAAVRQHLEAGMALNDANPALNADMRKVIERIATATDPRASAGPADGRPQDVGSAHVLLSNYRS